MQKFKKIIGLLAVALMVTVFTSCDKDLGAGDLVVENYTQKAIFELQERANCGRMGCFELVFPITIEFEDGSTAEVDDYDALKEVIMTWKENNPDATARPTFVFPIEVLSQNGEIATIESQEDLMALRMECRGQFMNGPRGHRFCFKLEFPVTIEFPDGTTAEVANRLELKHAIRTWKHDNPDSIERPQLSFPLTVKLRDGTTVTVNSREELQALKMECRNG